LLISSAKPLSLEELLDRVIQRRPELVRPVLKDAADIIMELIEQSLSNGREVSLRGFGRLIPRRYPPNLQKKFGLLFHPSPKLTAKLNK
jgi:nucleoid DNA-binding protein